MFLGVDTARIDISDIYMYVYLFRIEKKGFRNEQNEIFLSLLSFLDEEIVCTDDRAPSFISWTIR